MRAELVRLGYGVGESHGAIVPVAIGDQFRAVQAWRFAFDRGVYVNAVLPPAVAPRASGLRTSYSATHTEEQLEGVLGVFRDLRERLRRIPAGARRSRSSPVVRAELPHSSLAGRSS
jgi:7-keto-8-aminopelargonate synthetase-like enzyme